MRKVQSNRVTNLEWQQHPGNYLNSREDVLVSYFLKNTAYNCVSWSEDNVIAFTGPEGIYRASGKTHETKGVQTAEENDPTTLSNPSLNTRPSATETKIRTPGITVSGIPTPSPAAQESPVPAGNPEPLRASMAIDPEEINMPRSKNWKRRDIPISCLSHPIFITNPIFPSEHTTLVTTHQSRIKQLVFSPSAFGPLLLSADESGQVSIWEMKKHCTNQWECTQSFCIPHVIALFWVPLCLYSLPPFEARLVGVDLPQKFAQKGAAAPRIRIPAFLAICGNGAVNLVYKGSFECKWSMISIRLQTGGQLSRCDLIFIPRVDLSVTPKSSPEAKSAYLALGGASLPNRVAIYQLVFDFSGPLPNQRPYLKSKLEALISLLSKGLPQYSVVHVKFDRSLPLDDYKHRPVIVVTSNGKNCFVSKWEAKETDSQQMPSNPSYAMVADFQAKGLPQDSPFISVVQCFDNSHILFAYFDGTLEIRDKMLEIKETQRYQTLAPKYRKMKEESLSSVKAETKNETSFSSEDKKIIGKPYPSPLSIAVSPSNTAFCLLDYHSSIHIYVRANPFFPDDDTANGYLRSRVMANAFELCFVRGISYWDILLSFREYSSKSNVLTGIIGWLANDFQELTPESRELYYGHFHALYSCLLRMCDSQITNQIDSQARLFVNYIYDSYFSCFKQVKISIGDIGEEAQSAFANSQTIFVVCQGMDQVLYPLTEWVLYFAVFFMRNIFQFLQTEDPSDPPVITSTKYRESFFVYNAQAFPHLFPCLALLFDEHFMKQFMVLILASNAIRNQVAYSNEQITNKIVSHEIKNDTVKQLYSQIAAALAILRQLKQSNSEYDYKYFSNAKALLRAKLSAATLLPTLEKIRSMNQLYQDLDLAVPLMGFLEQNQMRENNKRALGMHCYEYSNIPPSILKKYDVISRAELDPELLHEQRIRQCTQCNRLSTILEGDKVDWQYTRWMRCCPICMGTWKLLFPPANNC